MIVDRVGIYRTNIIFRGGNSISTWTIPKGTEFRVGQIDKVYHKFISDTFGDWTYWDKDVTFIRDL